LGGLLRARKLIFISTGHRRACGSLFLLKLAVSARAESRFYFPQAASAVAAGCFHFPGRLPPRRRVGAGFSRFGGGGENLFFTFL
jgi:hypothetical protein